MSASSPDPSLVARMRAGDDAAFAQLIERHALPLRLFIRQLARGLPSGDQDEDDLHQLVIFRAWQLRAAFVEDESGGFHRWLTAMARNVVRERLRYLQGKGRRLGQGYVRAASIASAIPASITSVASGAARRETTDRLEKAMDELDGEARELIQLYYVEGLSLAEVAERTGRARSTVWEDSKQVLQRLRAAIRA